MSLLIVGAGPGMGSALANRLGSSERPVGLIGRDSATLESLAEELALSGISARAGVAEIGNPEQLAATIGGVCAEVGMPDVVVFNASAFVDGPPSSVSVQEFAEGLAVGVVGALVTIQAVVPMMRPADGGTILLTGSATAIEPWPAACGLSAQKAAMRNLALSAAEELEDDGIHVCTVTIMGTLKRDSPFDPRRIAETFAEVVDRPRDDWEPEVRYNG